MESHDNGRPVPPYEGQNTRPLHTDAGNAGKEKPHDSKAARPLKTFFYGFVGGVVAIALVLCLGTFTPLLNAFKNGSSSSNNGNITIDVNGDDTTLPEAVSAKCINSVVTIYVYSNTSSWNQYFGSSGSSSSPSALGSGVIISDEGSACYILTNYHVVSDISRAVVKVGDTQYEAEAVGSDSKTDLAVLKINASGLTPIEWGDSSEVTVGDWVMAIGSPYGYEQTVTTGIVSALYRSDVLKNETGTGSSTVYTDMIQTDAAINPGNSGGALVNSEGKLIGVNTYISSTSQSSAGLGFAIPVSTAKSVADQLIAGESVSHAFLGITMSTSTNPTGAAVTSVYKNTGAANAGIQTGDVITKIDSKTISSSNDVSVAVSSKSAGDTVSITYVRNGKETTTSATLGKDTDNTTTEYAENGSPTTKNSSNNGSGGYYYTPYGNSGSSSSSNSFWN